MKDNYHVRMALLNTRRRFQFFKSSCFISTTLTVKSAWHASIAELRRCAALLPQVDLMSEQ
eukprot:scaffold15857_cov29-Prasinocladus_malaysianus.AAC.1